jgi:hypothetical protein
MVLFMNAEDRSARGLDSGERIALETICDDGLARRVDGLTVLDYYDRISGTPAAKSIPVRVVAR